MHGTITQYVIYSRAKYTPESARDPGETRIYLKVTPPATDKWILYHRAYRVRALITVLDPLSYQYICQLRLTEHILYK